MSTLFAGGKPDISEILDEVPVEERMKALVRTLSAYIEQYHGGAVEMVGYESRRIKVKMSGACDGCNLAPVTLRGWVEGTIKQFFPEVQGVDAV